MSKSFEMSGLVRVIGNGPANLRTTPEILGFDGQANVMGKIPEGSGLNILSRPPSFYGVHPVFTDGARWYYVKARAKEVQGAFGLFTGWAAAFHFDDQLLEPITVEHICGDQEGTALKPNAEAYVYPPRDGGLRLRKRAQMESLVLGRIRPATVVTILGSPACDEGEVYGKVRKVLSWRVRAETENGVLEGWTYEVIDNKHVLIPV